MSAENVIFIDFFAVKVDGRDVNQGICLYENLFTDTLVDVTSVNFNSKNVYEDEIFGRQDITMFLRRIQWLQICKIPTDVRGTLKSIYEVKKMARKETRFLYRNMVFSQLKESWKKNTILLI